MGVQFGHGVQGARLTAQQTQSGSRHNNSPLAYNNQPGVDTVSFRFGAAAVSPLSAVDTVKAARALCEVLSIDPEAPMQDRRAAFNQKLGLSPGSDADRNPNQRPQAAREIKASIEAALGRTLDGAEAFDVMAHLLNASEQGLLHAFQSGIPLGNQEA